MANKFDNLIHGDKVCGMVRFPEGINSINCMVKAVEILMKVLTLKTEHL